MIVKVTVRTNSKISEVYPDSANTIREVLTEAGVDYAHGQTMLDGNTLNTGDLDRTLENFGFTGESGHDQVVIANVVKTTNA